MDYFFLDDEAKRSEIVAAVHMTVDTYDRLVWLDCGVLIFVVLVVRVFSKVIYDINLLLALLLGLYFPTLRPEIVFIFSIGLDKDLGRLEV